MNVPAKSKTAIGLGRIARYLYYIGLLAETFPFLIVAHWHIEDGTAELLTIFFCSGAVTSTVAAILLFFLSKDNWFYLLFSLAVFVCTAWPRF